jgi:hypothetical protein
MADKDVGKPDRRSLALFAQQGGTLLPAALAEVQSLGDEDAAHNLAMWCAWSCRTQSTQISWILGDAKLRRIFLRSFRRCMDAEAELQTVKL